MNGSDLTRAVRPGNARRRPQAADRFRVCASEGCSTVVSRYNLTDHCNRHRPRHYPRLRGVVGGG